MTAVFGPQPTRWGSGPGVGKRKLCEYPSKSRTTGVVSSAGETPLSRPIAKGSTASDSGSYSGSSLLNEASANPESSILSAGSSTPLKSSDLGDAGSKWTPSNSAASSSPPTSTTPTSSAVPAKVSPAPTAASSAATPSHSGTYPFSAFVASGYNLSHNRMAATPKMSPQTLQQTSSTETKIYLFET